MLELVEMEKPRPGPGEILIDVLAAGINRADLLQRKGNYPPPPGASAILGLVVLPPEGIDLVAAAGLVEVAATVQSNLGHAGLAAGDAFLVHGGAGGIGSFAVPFAKHLGGTVITPAGGPEKL